MTILRKIYWGNAFLAVICFFSIFVYPLISPFRISPSQNAVDNLVALGFLIYIFSFVLLILLASGSIRKLLIKNGHSILAYAPLWITGLYTAGITLYLVSIFSAGL
jgi:hypothetical protein